MIFSSTWYFRKCVFPLLTFTNSTIIFIQLTCSQFSAPLPECILPAWPHQFICFCSLFHHMQVPLPFQFCSLISRLVFQLVGLLLFIFFNRLFFVGSLLKYIIFFRRIDLLLAASGPLSSCGILYPFANTNDLFPLFA